MKLPSLVPVGLCAGILLSIEMKNFAAFGIGG
jgi:hypothetical protein